MPRRIGSGLLVLLLAAAGAFGLIALLSARDSSRLTVLAGPQASPRIGDAHLRRGSADPVYPTNPPTSGPHVVVTPRRDGVALTSDELLTALERGDVVLVYGDRTRTPRLKRVAASLAGPFTAALAAAGQAVIVDPLSTARLGSISALAWGRAQAIAGPSDPALTAFVTRWLGRGASADGAAR